MKYTASALALTAGLFMAVPANAATWTYQDVDADANLELTDTEFARFSGEVYGAWDVDANQQVDRNEFYTGLYNTWDVDNDEFLTEEEYTTGWNAWYGEGYEMTPYADLAGDDARLGADEFAAGFEDDELFGEWDTADAGYLDAEGFNRGLYGTWAGEDEVLAEEEYNEWYTLAGDDGWF